MRPAVHASFLRNRGLHQKRKAPTHKFSAKRLLLMVVCGILLFIPGLTLTIVGLHNDEKDYEVMDEAHRIMYQAIGPAMGILGIVIMFASCIYFNCYGSTPQTPAPLNSQQQPVPEQDQDDKGSIRSKQRDQTQQIQNSYTHQQKLHNGRSIDVHTPDSESRRILKEELGSQPNNKAPHRTSDPAEEDEDVPLATIEDTTVLT